MFDLPHALYILIQLKNWTAPRGRTTVTTKMGNDAGIFSGTYRGFLPQEVELPHLG